MSMYLLPPKLDVCQKCATDHQPELPHNQQSLYWQYWFHGKHGRWPRWKDAIEHCNEEMKQFWIEALKERGISIE